MKQIVIPKGTRDFSFHEITQRNYVIKIIKKHFELFGFTPIETPSFEMLNILNEKYGTESNKLIFRILNSGNLSNYKQYIQTNNIEDHQLIHYLSEKALRYDLTVPLVRYLTMHINQIQLPFKRYQIQLVWRADRPQKGRFREFYQCDADIVSSSQSFWQEIELISIYEKIFYDLNIPIIININHYGIIYALSKILGIQGNIQNFVMSLDKLEKIGIKAVKEEIEAQYNISLSLKKFINLLIITGDFHEQLELLYKNFHDIPEGKNALEYLLLIYQKLATILDNNKIIKLNISLSRGLNYYTGIMFEVKSTLTNYNFSIASGGRYDNLINMFGLKNIYGIGISFGLDRICLIMQTLKLFTNIKQKNIPKIMFINFGIQETMYVYKILKILRFKYHISSELYPESIKISKQLKYAYNKGIIFVAIIGNYEITNNIMTIKNLKTGIESVYSNIESFVKELNSTT